jgi:TP901 family phage tail tape measure protein
MADLKARFSLIDDMSDKMSQIGESGLNAMEAWEQAGEAASSAIDGVASSATQTATAVDGVAQSIDEINSSAGDAGGAADELSAALNNLDNAMEAASAGTDNWTAAAQQYDKSALEMIYTTEELVEMGLKTADALGNVDEMYELCEAAAGQLNSELENSTAAHEALAEAVQSAERVMEEFADNGKISAEASERLDEANQAAANAIAELEAAQSEAKAAMDAYDETIISGTTDLDELAAAAERAETAASNLASANENASKATEELSGAIENAGESAKETEEKGKEAIETISQTLASAGIIKMLDEAAEKAYELADAFSESQKIVVNATGATGETLEGLEQSMMNAYSNNKQSLDTTASAIGEINTRMGLQGDVLSDVTGKFLDYSNVTNTNVVNSVANVTKIMNKWNEEQENVESVMDKLVYASQISGASVDSLSSSLINGAGAFQQVELSLDNTISLLAAFELYGLNSSTAIMAMRNAVRHFSDDGEDAGEGLRRVIDEIANMESAAEATSLACEVFGSRAGVEMANAIRNGAISIETLNGDLDAAQGALSKTAQAGETLSEKWERSNNKIKTAFTSALQPTLDKCSAGLAKIVGGIGDFLNKHPAFTKALTAIGIGLGVVAVALAGYTAAMALAKVATTAFAAVLNMTPLGWAATAIAGVTAAGIALVSMFSKSKNEVEDYNGTMEECQAEIQRTEAAYQKACELYGENSSAAMELSDTLDTLNAQFDKGGGVLAVYSEQANKLADSFSELSSAQHKAIEEIDKTETSGLTAVAMLSALSEQSNYTNADLDLMAEYADYLNDTFNCDIKVNYDTGELTGFDPTDVINEIMSLADNQRYQQAMEYLSAPDFMDTYTEAKRQIHDLGIQIDQLEMLRDNAGNAPASSYGSTWGKTEQEQLESLTETYNTYKDTLEQCETEIEQYGSIIDETGAFNETYKSTLDDIAYGLDDVSQRKQELTEQELEWNEAAAYAYESVREEITALCEAYEEAYNTALESFQGQFSLFDQASTTSETYLSSTVANAQAALDTQLNYWTTYGENIEFLKGQSAEALGLTQENYEALMSYVQSGSEEAAGLAQSMVTEIQNGHTDAVTELGNTVAEVNAKQDEIAASVADWKTNFAAEMDAILQKANSTIDSLNLSDEASAAAKGTMDAYIAQLKSSGQEAVATAQYIANWISSALSSANAKINVSLSTSGVQHNATGTTNADDVFIAGEEGPELVVGKGGSTVFPTSETNKIISALEGMDTQTETPTVYSNTSTNTTTSNYSRAVENFDQRETTEINNSYTTIENGSSYDDGRIITILTGFLDVFSALEKKIGTNNSAETPELNVFDAYENGTTSSEDTFIAGEKGPELIVGQPDSYVFPTEETDRIIKAIGAYEAVEPYDFTPLEKSMSRQNSDITNLDESVNYGDSYSVSNIRNYNTEYGDAVRNSLENEYTEAVSNVSNAETTYGDNIDRSYSETVNYGDVVRSYEENVRGGDSSYNAVTSYDNERSYTASADTSYGDTIDNELNYGDIVRNVSEETSNSNDKAYSETVNYGDVVRNFAENNSGDSEQRYNTSTIASNIFNSLENSLQRNESTSYKSSLSNSYQTDHTLSNYNNTSESVENALESVSNLSKATSLTNNAESHSDSMSVLSEAIRNSNAESDHYENALTTLGDEISNSSTQTEQAIQNMESLTNGNTFNNSENNVERMEQSIANDNQAYETAESTNNISRQAYYDTANTYGGAEYIDNRGTSTAYQNDDNRVYGDTTAYGDSIRNFESSYINTENTPQTFEDRTESVFIPFMGIISAMIEKALKGNLSAVEASDETAYTFAVPEDREAEYTISIPEIPEQDNDNRIIAERGVDRKDDGAGRDTNADVETGTESVKRIVLEIAGSGSIDISDGVDEEKVLELIEDNIKPVLMNIIQTEIYEEGELSYEF